MTSYFMKYDVIFFTTSYHIETQHITDALFLHGTLLGNGVETGVELALKTKSRHAVQRVGSSFLRLISPQFQRCCRAIFHVEKARL